MIQDENKEEQIGNFVRSTGGRRTFPEKSRPNSAWKATQNRLSDSLPDLQKTDENTEEQEITEIEGNTVQFQMPKSKSEVFEVSRGPLNHYNITYYD